MIKSILLFLPLWFTATSSLAGSTRDSDVLAQAHRSQLAFREGHAEVVKPMLKSLEDAVARSPENPQLWEALGHAYMAKLASMYSPTLDIPALTANAERARDAYAHSLALKANGALSLASHGMASMVASQFKGDGPGMMAGIDEMNAAVRQAPKSVTVRLTRAFTTIHLPPQVRDTNAVIEDLGFILDTAPGGRAEDVMHLLLGDVYAETGKLDAARGEYRQVSGASAFAAEQAKSRLEQDTIAPASIALVRAGTGVRCAMCHAPGSDN